MLGESSEGSHDNAGRRPEMPKKLQVKNVSEKKLEQK